MFTDKPKRSSEDLTKEQNKIAQGTSYNGDITSQGSFRIEGKVEGTIKTSGKIVIGKSGEVEGEINCENADIEGAFKGEISVNDTLVLRTTAKVNGNAQVDKLSIEPGAVFNAKCTMKSAVKDLSSESKRSKKQIPKKDRPHSRWIALSGAGIQMGVVIFASAYIGDKLDTNYENQTPWFTLRLCFVWYIYKFIFIDKTNK